MIFQSEANRRYCETLKNHQICFKKLAKNEENPCLTLPYDPSLVSLPKMALFSVFLPHFAASEHRFVMLQQHIC